MMTDDEKKALAMLVEEVREALVYARPFETNDELERAYELMVSCAHVLRPEVARAFGMEVSLLVSQRLAAAVVVYEAKTRRD